MTADDRKKPRVKTERKESHLSCLWRFIKSVVLGLSQCLSSLWTLNPLKMISRRQKRLYVMESYDGLVIKPKFKDRVVDLFLSDYRRRQRILHWVHTKLRTTEVHDFSTCWQDGTLLCALLESICPGVCPSFHLLSPLNMVKNCRLGIKLANKYLYVPMDLLTPEEMAIASKESEFRIIQYVSMIKWASENIKEKWSTLHESLIAAKTGRCFAKGSGLRNGIVGKRSKFTIVVSDTIGVFNLLVEVRGPNNEYSGERIVSLHQAKGITETPLDTSKPLDILKYLEDCVGNTFIRKKIPGRYAADSQTDLLCLDFQCGEEGTFYVTFVPRRAGIHAVAVKWQNHHVESSPFRIKVYKASNVSSNSMKGAREKRVIYDSLSLTTLPTHSDESFDVEQLREHTTGTQQHDQGSRFINTITKAKAYGKGRQLTVIGRKVLRRVITRNGEDIVIEEAISPSLSRQSSITDNSDDDYRFQKQKEENSPVKMATTPGLSCSLSNNTKTANLLGTVQEEKQNSKESLFKNIDLSEIVLSDSFRQKLEEYNMKAINIQEDATNEMKKETGYQVNTPDVSMTTSRKVPFSKYTCSGINEHNLLDIDDNQMTENCPDLSTQEVVTSSWFGEDPPNRNTPSANRGPLKRSPLQRTPSFHNGNKAPARRTVSDGKIYTLRRSIVSFAASDMSETSSELSSDDRQSGAEDDSGVTGHALKLLHSHSLRKACMYISENTFPNIRLNDGGEQTADTDMTEGLIPFPVKTKLRASWSLPSSEKPILNGKDTPLQNLSETLYKESDIYAKPNCIKRNSSQSGENSKISTDIFSEKSTWNGNEYDGRHLLDDITGTFVNIYITDGHKTHATDYIDTVTKAENDVLRRSVDINEKALSEGLEKEEQYQNRVVSRYHHAVNENETRETSEDNATEEYAVNWHHKTTLYKDVEAPTLRSRLPRGTLTRQWKVCCQKSTQDSSTDPDQILECSPLCISDEKFAREQREVSKIPINTPFKSIFIQSSDDTGDKFTREVLIVVPKPKIDKQTQVCDSEIIQETGWDLLEGFYLLLRRISVKLPDSDNVISSPFSDFPYEDSVVKMSPKPDSSSRQTHKICQENLKSNNAKVQCLQVLFDNNSENVYAGVSDTSSCLQLSPRSGSSEGSNVLDRKSSDNQTVEDSDDRDNHVMRKSFSNGDNVIVKEVTRPNHISYHNAVDEWFRRNESILNVPQRQQTVETVDSGFDDNPNHFNRHARYSLPSLRTVSGHVRLYRRNYRGKIPLDPKLVTSNSSHSLSFDKRDLGNEADDELLLNSSTEQSHTRSQRRRHKRQTRDNSVSFSDSEINQRRHYLRKRHVGARRQCMTHQKACESVKESDGASATECINSVKMQPDMVSDRTNEILETYAEHQDSLDKSNEKRAYDIKDQVKIRDKNGREENSSLEISDIHVSRKNMTNNRSTTASSLDSNYCGFGVTKPNRHALLSHLGDFQNLYTTEEKPDEETLTNTEKDIVFEKDRTPDQTSQLDPGTDTCFKSNLNGYSVRDDDHTQKRLNSDDKMSVSLENKSQEDGVVDGSESSYLTAKLDNDFDVAATNSLTKSDVQQEGISMTNIFAQQLDNDVFFDNNVFFDDISASEDDMTVHVAGAGLYHGFVGVNNSFQVWTDRNVFNGSLSVNITGPRSHTVTETSVLYTGDNLYEVSYGVTHPGFYKIYVKWGDEDLPNSPFICQITL